MRCLACDKRLNNRESTRKYASSGAFIDLCDQCFSYVSEEIPDVSDGIDPEEFNEDSEVESTSDWENEGLSTYGVGDDSNGQE